jgi:hypothetical protein
MPGFIDLDTDIPGGDPLYRTRRFADGPLLASSPTFRRDEMYVLIGGLSIA